MKININLLHVIFIGPFLIYIGLVKPQSSLLYYILFGLGLLVFLKFLYSLLTQEISQRSVWYVLHMLLFAMIAMYVGGHQNQTLRIGYSLLLATGISAFGYHLIRFLGFH